MDHLVTLEIIIEKVFVLQAQILAVQNCGYLDCIEFTELEK